MLLGEQIGQSDCFLSRSFSHLHYTHPFQNRLKLWN